jgi:hypothetical protein
MDSTPGIIKSFVCFLFLSKSLEVCSNHVPRATKVPKAGMLGQIEKHKGKGKQEVIIFGCCETFIYPGSLLTKM